MRIPAALALFVFVACDDPATAPHPDRLFSDADRSGCPESPFKPEYPIAPKMAATADAAFYYHVEIYTSRGVFVREWTGTYDPDEAQDPRMPRTAATWDGRDATGNPAPSGYYFFVMTATAPNSTVSETQSRCVFWVHPDDEGKMK